MAPDETEIVESAAPSSPPRNGKRSARPMSPLKGSWASLMRITNAKRALRSSARNTILRYQESSASSAEMVKVSTEQLKHFHGAALDYLWRREAERSKNWRIQLFVLMEVPTSSRLAMLIAVLLSAAILAQLIVIYLQDHLTAKQEFAADAIMTGIFTIEFVVRAFASVSAYQTRELLSNGFFYLDLAAVLPFYVSLAVDYKAAVGGSSDTNNESPLEILRLLRIVRIFKLTRTYPGAATLGRAMKISGPALLVPVVFLVLGAAFLGAVLYFFEKLEADLSSNNGTETAFPHVNDALWFMIVTFSTVGYGDFSPNTNVGKAITVVAILCGVIFMSMPITIVGNNFAFVLEEKEKLAVVLSIQKHLIDRNMRAENILDLFNEIDDNLDGAIDYKEFKRFVVKLGVSLKPSSLRRLFQVFDEDNSGRVTCKEFCHLIFPDVDTADMLDSEGGGAAAITLQMPGEQPRMLNTDADRQASPALGAAEASHSSPDTCMWAAGWARLAREALLAGWVGWVQGPWMPWAGAGCGQGSSCLMSRLSRPTRTHAGWSCPSQSRRCPSRRKSRRAWSRAHNGRGSMPPARHPRERRTPRRQQMRGLL